MATKGESATVLGVEDSPIPHCTVAKHGMVPSDGKRHISRHPEIEGTLSSCPLPEGIQCNQTCSVLKGRWIGLETEVLEASCGGGASPCERLRCPQGRQEASRGTRRVWHPFF